MPLFQVGMLFLPGKERKYSGAYGTYTVTGLKYSVDLKNLRPVKFQEPEVIIIFVKITVTSNTAVAFNIQFVNISLK